MSVENDSKGKFMEVQTYVDNGEEDNSARVPVDVTAPGTFEIDGNGVRRRDAEHYNSWSNDSGHEQTVLSTLQNASGSPTADFTNVDESKFSVEVDGLRTSLSVAIKLGYVIKDNNGYRDGEPGKTFTPADITPEVNMSVPVNKSVSELRAAIGENNANSLIHSAIGSVINQDGDDSPAFNNLGSTLGLEKGDGGEIAKAIANDLAENLLTKTASKYSLDANELMGFLGECTNQIKTQLILRTLHGDPQVYQELASRYRFKNKM